MLQVAMRAEESKITLEETLSAGLQPDKNKQKPDSAFKIILPVKNYSLFSIYDKQIHELTYSHKVFTVRTFLMGL